MSEQGGALGELRAAITAIGRAEYFLGAVDWEAALVDPDEDERAHHRQRAGFDAKNALDAALTAVEARLGRLVRCVRAADAWLDDEADDDEIERLHDDYVAARAAITDADLSD
jgi:hypothetical protein